MYCKIALNQKQYNEFDVSVHILPEKQLYLYYRYQNSTSTSKYSSITLGSWIKGIEEMAVLEILENRT